MQYVMTFGGEPLLYPETVFAIHDTATKCGIPGRTIITNTSIPAAEDEFRVIAHKLADSGVNSMYLSVDVFHQEYIPLAVVKQNTRLLIDAGIENLAWNVSWVVSPEADNPWDDQTRHILEELADLGLGKDNITITPDGAAVHNLIEYMPPRQSIPSGTCGDKPFTGRLDEVTSITVEPDGNLTICDELMSIGNLNHDNAAAICQKYDPYLVPSLRIILEQGPSGLIDLNRQHGTEIPSKKYYSVCEMCYTLRKTLITK
jgi:MoaA/NifB/PqqE/SkfB family radical SAM enzyme